MRYMLIVLLSAGLVLAAGCTEESPEGGWNVDRDTGTDATDDTGSGDATSDASDDSTDPDAVADTGGDTGGDTDVCGAADGMCDWECPTEDPDCDNCPSADAFTGGPYDTQECMLIDFACPEGSDYYNDDVCGCGCMPDTTDPCAAQDARGQGACAAVVGVIWDGEACRSISGCSCAGPDCDKTYQTVEECERDRSECLEPECGAMDAEGVGACDAVLGWAWSGKDLGCQLLSGCECEGSDCADLYETESACQQGYSQCMLGARCGGWGGLACPDGMYCDYPNNSCGAADGTGVCKDAPHACPEVIDEVCGCNNQVYTNECFAHSSGVDVWSDLGPCQR